MIDYTDRKSVKDFVEENDIRDLAQLDTFLKQITGVVLEDMLFVLWLSRRKERLSEMTILATPDTIQLAKRQRTQGMAIPRRQFAPFMARWSWTSPETGMATLSQNSSRSISVTFLE